MMYKEPLSRNLLQRFGNVPNDHAQRCEQDQNRLDGVNRPRRVDGRHGSAEPGANGIQRIVSGGQLVDLDGRESLCL